ncbi:MAG: helix-turn-helix domain-containing protein [Solimonas sp.]
MQSAASTEQRQLLRIRIVLDAAEGHTTREIARWLETTPTTVSLWRGRLRERLAGLVDLPRSGAPPIYGEETDKRTRAVLDQPPPAGFVRWNGRLRRALGNSARGLVTGVGSLAHCQLREHLRLPTRE